MQPSDKCIDFIKSFEGFYPKPYHDSPDREDIITIGYGSITYEDGTKVKLTDRPITEQRATELVKWEATEKAKAITKALKQQISQNKFDSLVSFAYNLGTSALINVSTLFKKVNINPNDLTIADEFKKWVYSNGKEVSGLVRRRNEEAKLYFSK